MVTFILSILTCISIIYFFFWKKSPYRWLFAPVFFFSLSNIIDFVMIEYINAPLTSTILLMQDVYHGAIIVYYIVLLHILEKER